MVLESQVAKWGMKFSFLIRLVLSFNLRVVVSYHAAPLVIFRIEFLGFMATFLSLQEIENS